MAGYRRWLLVLCLVGLGCGGRAQTGVDLQNQAVSLNDAGYQYYRQSRFNVAEEKFSQALKINRLIDRRVGIAANLNNLGVIAQEQGDPKKAAAYFLEALSINRDLEAPAGSFRDPEQPGAGLPGPGQGGRGPKGLSGSPGICPNAAARVLAVPIVDPPGGRGPGPEGL